jgi:tryptophan synthase beta chain
LKEQGRVSYRSATDREALDAFQYLATEEGIIPALEPSHALAELIKIAPEMPAEAIVILNLCGRGDKDILTVSSLIDGDNDAQAKARVTSHR